MRYTARRGRRWSNGPRACRGWPNSDTSVRAGNTYTYQVAAEVSGGEATRSGRVTASGAVTSLAPQAALGRSLVTFASRSGGDVSGGLHGRPAGSRGDADEGGAPGGAAGAGRRAADASGSAGVRVDGRGDRPGVTPSRTVHLTELRGALGAAYAAAGHPAPVDTEARVVPGVTPMRAVHLQELRAAVVTLETGVARTGLASGGVSDAAGTP